MAGALELAISDAVAAARSRILRMVPPVIATTDRAAPGLSGWPKLNKA